LIPAWCTSRPAGAQLVGPGGQRRPNTIRAFMWVALFDVFDAVVDLVECADSMDDPGVTHPFT